MRHATNYTGKRIRFVSAADIAYSTIDVRTSEECAPKVAASGREIRAFYETLLAEPSTSMTSLSDAEKTKCNKSVRHKCTELRKSRNGEHHRDSDDDITDKTFVQFLKDATDGNLRAVQNFHAKGINMNRSDRYGWTALMCAACAGHLHIVKYLLSNGADIAKQSKSGETASDLALKCGNRNVYRYISEFKNAQSSQCERPTRKAKKSRKESDTEHFCDACQCRYIGEAHRSSVAHLLETRRPVLDPGYGIPEWNKGYCILRSCGWDEFEGLGRDSNGRRYPVKTVLKRDRLGLGCAADTPKMAHFKANDVSAVKMRTSGKGREMRAYKEKLLREKNLERQLRSMFRDND